MTNKNVLGLLLAMLILPVTLLGNSGSLNLLAERFGEDYDNIWHLGRQDKHAYFLAEKKNSYEILNFDFASETLKVIAPEVLKFDGNARNYRYFNGFSIGNKAFLPFIGKKSKIILTIELNDTGKAESRTVDNLKILHSPNASTFTLKEGTSTKTYDQNWTEVSSFDGPKPEDQGDPSFWTGWQIDQMGTMFHFKYDDISTTKRRGHERYSVYALANQGDAPTLRYNLNLECSNVNQLLVRKLNDELTAIFLYYTDKNNSTCDYPSKRPFFSKGMLLDVFETKTGKLVHQFKSDLEPLLGEKNTTNDGEARSLVPQDFFPIWNGYLAIGEQAYL